MKKVMLFALAMSLVASTTGCMGLARVAKELKNDPAQVTLQVTSIYGTARFTRNGSPTNQFTFSPDGTLAPAYPPVPPAPVTIVVTNVVPSARR